MTVLLQLGITDLNVAVAAVVFAIISRAAREPPE